MISQLIHVISTDFSVDFQRFWLLISSDFWVRCTRFLMLRTPRNGLVEDYIFYKMTPNFMGHSYVTATPNIMGLSYVLSFMGLPYVLVTYNVMNLSYVQ